MTSPTNVLVVEDEMVLRMRAVDIVEDAGFTAVEAVNADEALAILTRRTCLSMAGVVLPCLQLFSLARTYSSITHVNVFAVTGKPRSCMACRP